MKAPKALLRRVISPFGNNWQRRFQKFLSVEGAQIFDFTPLSNYCVRKLERYKRQALGMAQQKSQRKNSHQDSEGGE